MVTKKKPQRYYENLVLRVDDYSARASCGINYELAAFGQKDPSTKIYRSETHIKIKGECLSPQKRAGVPYEVLVYLDAVSGDQNTLTLSATHDRSSKRPAMLSSRKRGRSDEL